MPFVVSMYICIFHMQICFCVSTIWYRISYSRRLSKSFGTEHDQTGPAHTIYVLIVGIWLACSGTLGPYILLVQQYKVLIDAVLVLFRHWSLYSWGHECSLSCRARIAILLSDRWIKGKLVLNILLGIFTSVMLSRNTFLSV